MINLSILFLSHLGNDRSPFILSSSLTQKKSIFFSNIFFTKSFSSFFFCFGNNYHHSCSIKNSKFSYFLSQSIFLQRQIYLTNQIYELTNQYFDEDPVSIWNCVFRKFYLTDQFGAAIYTVYDIQLFNVNFDEIVSKGGALYSECQIASNYLTFQNVKANISACFISKPGNFSNPINNSITIENCLIKNAISDKNFGFLNQEIGSTLFSYSNVTNCQAIESIGMIECYYSDLFTKYASFSFIKSPKNSISFTSFSNKCKFSYCLFHSIVCNQSLFQTINVVNVCLKNCLFSLIINKPKNSNQFPQIFALNCTNLRISSCCFDKKKDEIYQKSQFDHLEIDSNFYSIKKCFNNDSSSLDRYNNNAGYSYQRTPTYLPQLAPSPTYNYFFDNSNVYIVSIEDINVMINVSFIIICFLIVLMICVLIYDNYRYFFRQSRCLFNIKDSKEVL